MSNSIITNREALAILRASAPEGSTFWREGSLTEEFLSAPIEVRFKPNPDDPSDTMMSLGAILYVINSDELADSPMARRVQAFLNLREAMEA